MTAIARDSLAGKLASYFMKIVSAALVGIALGLRAATLGAPVPIALRFAVAASTAALVAWYALSQMRPAVAGPDASLD